MQFYNDYLRFPDRKEFSDCSQFHAVSLEDSYTDYKLAKHFTTLAKPSYKAKVVPATLLPTSLGNLYTASLYAGILSLIHSSHTSLPGQRVLLFSYGSGLAASMFSVVVRSDDESIAALNRIASVVSLEDRLAERLKQSPVVFNETMQVREKLHDTNKDFSPSGDIDDLADGTYYLTHINENHQRQYACKVNSV
jgi:hydroxymethylglutaryl-CoA synthase